MFSVRIFPRSRYWELAQAFKRKNDISTYNQKISVRRVEEGGMKKGSSGGRTEGTGEMGRGRGWVMGDGRWQKEGELTKGCTYLYGWLMAIYIYLYIRQYIVIITNPGIQKLTELEMMAYVLFATNMQESVCSSCHCSDSDVVYQPKNIGVKDMRAGNSHTLASMKNTVLFVI